MATAVQSGPGTSIATMQRPTLSAQFAAKYGIDQKQVFSILKETALKSKDPVSDAEVAAFMVICNNYDLNPFIKEIFGFISKGKMQYVISVDGWSTLVNRQQQLNGIEFVENFRGENLASITCKMHRKDRALPTVITEYLSECRGSTDTWQKWPVRMLRHKALIQCARIAFGLAGVMDEDEAERMDGWRSNAPTPIIEGQRSHVATAVFMGDAELSALVERLGWSQSKKQLCLSNFQGNMAGMREYIFSEAQKAGLNPYPDVRPDTHAEEIADAQDNHGQGEYEQQEEMSEGTAVVETLADIFTQTAKQAAPAQQKPAGRKAPNTNW